MVRVVWVLRGGQQAALVREVLGQAVRQQVALALALARVQGTGLARVVLEQEARV